MQNFNIGNVTKLVDEMTFDEVYEFLNQNSIFMYKNVQLLKKKYNSNDSNFFYKDENLYLIYKIMFERICSYLMHPWDRKKILVDDWTRRKNYARATDRSETLYDFVFDSIFEPYFVKESEYWKTNKEKIEDNYEDLYTYVRNKTTPTFEQFKQLFLKMFDYNMMDHAKDTSQWEDEWEDALFESIKKEILKELKK